MVSKIKRMQFGILATRRILKHWADKKNLGVSYRSGEGERGEGKRVKLGR